MKWNEKKTEKHKRSNQRRTHGSKNKQTNKLGEKPNNNNNNNEKTKQNNINNKNKQQPTNKSTYHTHRTTIETLMNLVKF